MERPELESWFIKADQVLAEESAVLDELKRAVNENYITQEDAEERMKAYHDGLTANNDDRDR